MKEVWEAFEDLEEEISEGYSLTVISYKKINKKNEKKRKKRKKRKKKNLLRKRIQN